MFFCPQFTTVISVKKESAVPGPEPTPVRGVPMALSGQRLRVLEFVRAHSPVRVADAAAALGLHPNTVRYRLRRVADTVGLDPQNARDAWVLQVALALGRTSRPVRGSRRPASPTP